MLIDAIHKNEAGKEERGLRGHMKHDPEDFSDKGALEQDAGKSETVRLSSPGKNVQAENTLRLQLVWQTWDAKRPGSQGRVSTWRAGDETRARGQRRGRTAEGLEGCAVDLLLTRGEIGNH